MKILKGSKIDTLRRLFIWLSRGCNARCVMCDIWREPVDSKLEASWLLDRIPEIQDLAPDSIILCGEPLIHPDIKAIVACLCDAGLRIEMLTNGLLLSKYANLIIEQCHALRVSLDGPAEIHNRTRGHNSAFQCLETGLSMMLDLAPEYDVQARCVVHSMNFRYLPDTVRSARELGVRGISFSAMDIENAQAFQRKGRLKEQAHLLIGESDLDELQRELLRFYDECDSDFKNGFITDNKADIHNNIWLHYASLAGREVRLTPICDAPWTSAILEHDGTLRPCFPMPAYSKVKPGQSLRDTLNAAEAMRFRNELDVASDPRCYGCVCRSTPQRP